MDPPNNTNSLDRRVLIKSLILISPNYADGDLRTDLIKKEEIRFKTS